MNIALQFFRRHYWWLLPLLAVDVVFFRWLHIRGRESAERAAEEESIRRDAAKPRVDPGLLYGYPTPQTGLMRTNDPSVYMPTASGRIESALYGSVRTIQRGNRLLPRFHAGLDIAPLNRTPSGEPLDAVMAVTDGRILYVNPIGGNSSYGIYVVLKHADRVGDIYTLYAHLAGLENGITNEAFVSRGQTLGRMGNTASTGIPMARAHLHFEIGMIYNLNFAEWGLAKHEGLNHGIGHGWNLVSVNPLAVYGNDADALRFCMATHLKNTQHAFMLAFQAADRPDYFRRYPGLWRGDGPLEAIVIAVSESGVPLWGRAATGTERETLLSQGKPTILHVDESVLGRNGRRLIMQKNGRWELSAGGHRWMDIVTWNGS